MSVLNLRTYTWASLISTSLCLGNAYLATNGGQQFLTHLLRSKLNVLVLVNMAYCCLFYFGKLTQKIFFGKLRESESQNINDRLLNYILFKIVFVGAVLEPELRELLVWISWFSILGFMKIFSLLARDRFEYIITFSPNTSNSTHMRILVLLCIILFSDLVWFYLCVSKFYVAGASVVLLLTFECFTLFLDTVQTLVKYGIHLIDLRREGLWEQRGTYIYYTEFVTDSLVLVATLAHYLQILILHGLSFTLIDVIIFFQMRAVFNNLREKFISYRNYRTLVTALNTGYENVGSEELATYNDDCAICRERMTAAKRLPCGHIFHMSCLRSWLEQHHSCPTCRRSLIDNSTETIRRAAGPVNPIGRGGFGGLGGLGGMGAGVRQQQQPAAPGWGFQFQGFLPSFEPRGVVLQEMIRSLQETFPHIPDHILAADLRLTHSVEMTAENILEGRLVYDEPPTPQPQTQQPQQQQWNAPPAITVPAPAPTPQTPSIPFSPPRSNSLPPLSPSSPQPHSSVSPSASPIISSTSPSQPGVFPTSPVERQSILEARKQALRDQALKRYLEKKTVKPGVPSSSSSPLSPSDSSSSSFFSTSPTTTTATSSTSSPSVSTIGPFPSLPLSPSTPLSSRAPNTPSSPSLTTATTTTTTTSQQAANENLSTSVILEDETPEMRRKRLYEAAELRLRQNKQQ